MAKKQPKFEVLDYWRDSVYNNCGFYPQMNRHTEQWTAVNLIESYGKSTVLDLIDYYISICTTTPKWDTFKFKCDDLLTKKLEIEEDLKQREENRKKAKEWLLT